MHYAGRGRGLWLPFRGPSASKGSPATGEIEMEIRQERAFVNKIDTSREGGGRVHPRWPDQRVRGGGVRNHGNLCTLTEGSLVNGGKRGGSRVVARGKVFAHRETTREILSRVSSFSFSSSKTRISKLTRLDRYVY